MKKHERGTLTEVTRLRSGLPKSSKNQQLQTMKKIDSMITGFFEAYPNLISGKSHENFMSEIRITEDRISAKFGFSILDSVMDRTEWVSDGDLKQLRLVKEKC